MVSVGRNDLVQWRRVVYKVDEHIKAVYLGYMSGRKYFRAASLIFVHIFR